MAFESKQSKDQKSKVVKSGYTKISTERGQAVGGLSTLRAETKNPPVVCPNCKCARYSPCGCKKRSV